MDTTNLVPISEKNNKIFDHMKKYCEDRRFRLTLLNGKFHLVWVAFGNIRQQDFDDFTEVKKFVDWRDKNEEI